MRYLAIDAFRFVAIFFVVFLHSRNLFPEDGIVFLYGSSLARLAVPFFLINTGFFLERRVFEGGVTTKIWAKYTFRLFIPLVFWGVFYALMPSNWPVAFSEYGLAAVSNRLAEVHAQYFTSKFPIGFFLSGGKYHLWFLSSLLIGVSAWLVARRFFQPWLLLIGGTVAFCVALGISVYRPVLGLDFGDRFNFVNLGPVLAVFYLSLGALLYRLERKPAAATAFIAFAAFLVVEMIEMTVLFFVYDVPPENMYFLAATAPAAGALYLALINVHNYEWLKRAADLGRYALGAYALHVFFLEPVILWLSPSSSAGTALLVVAGVTVVTFGAVWLLARIKPLQKVLV